MKKLILGLLTSLGLSLMAHAADGGVSKYNLDPGHTQVIFRASHLGFSHTVGQFTDVSGHFEIDEATGKNGKIMVSIKSDSISTYNKDRDDHLKGPDFFDTKKFPEIKFESTKVTKKSEKEYNIDGKLSMHGVTKPVSFIFHRYKTGKDPWGKTRTGGQVKFVVKRSDFGLKYMLGTDKIADEVDMEINLEGIL